MSFIFSRRFTLVLSITFEYTGRLVSLYLAFPIPNLKSSIFPEMFIPILIAAYVPMGEWTRLLIVFSGFIPALIGFIYAVKIEQMAGYYECAKCKHRYVPTLKAACWAPHKGRTRNMKCPACGEKSWQKKVITKE